MSAIELAAGAALSIAINLIHVAIKKAKDRSLTTKSILDRLEATIHRITPLLAQVAVSESKVIDELNLLLVKAASLVEGYTELRRRNLLKKYRYMRRLKELDALLTLMVAVDVQVVQMVDIKKLMATTSEINTKLDEITRQNCLSHKKKYSVPEINNQNIVQANDQSSKENDECSGDGSNPKIDIHLRWKSGMIRFNWKG